MKDVQQSVLKSAEQFNPTGANNMAADTLKNWLNGTNQALNALNKISSQFSEFANKNFEAFHNSEAKPTKQSTKK